MKALAGIVLAAGASSRLGSPKQLVTLHGETLVARVSKLALSQCEDGVIVVTGEEHERIVDALSGTAATTVRNVRWREGLGTSLSCAVAALSPMTRAVLVLLTDQPLIDKADLNRLVSAAHTRPDSIAAAAYNRGLGVPAIFPERNFAELRQLGGDRGAKQIISEQSGVSAVQMPNAEFDLDTPEALIRLRNIEKLLQR